MQMSDFAKQMNETFHPLKRIGIFKAAKVEEKSAYLFNENHLPTMGAWYIAGEILLWSLWFVWFLISIAIWSFGGNEDIVVNNLLIKGHLLTSVWGMLEATLVFFVGCIILFLFIPMVLIYGVYLYPALSLVIWSAKETKKKSTFWFILIFWGVFCLFLSMWIGKPAFISVRVNSQWETVPSTWVDWINPDKNYLMLFLGYPVFLFVVFGALIINVLYHKYKPKMDENWSAEGLDSHLLDGDADN